MSCNDIIKKPVQTTGFFMVNLFVRINFPMFDLAFINDPKSINNPRITRAVIAF